ncbi:hypothetical protein ABZ769_30555 [Streptomyces olivoreticuli]
MLSEGPLKDLNDALHDLHLRAGRPSLSEMAAKITDGRISRSSLHEALTSAALPRWDTVDALVEILATRARKTSPEQEIDRFNELWQEAAQPSPKRAVPHQPSPPEALLPRLSLPQEVPMLPGSVEAALVGHLAAHPEGVSETVELLDRMVALGAQQVAHDREATKMVRFMVDRGLIMPTDLEALRREVHRLQDPDVIDAEIIDGP